MCFLLNVCNFNIAYKILNTMLNTCLVSRENWTLTSVSSCSSLSFVFKIHLAFAGKINKFAKPQSSNVAAI